MACPVTTKDIFKEISNKLVDKLRTARPINGGSAVFAAYNITNREKLASQVKTAIDEVDAEFNSKIFGSNFEKMTRDDYGITVKFIENHNLADALYAQNIRDEMGPDFYMGDEALRDQEEEYAFSPRLQQNAKRPLTDNFTEYRNYKEAQLKRVEGLLKSYKQAKKDPKKDLSKTVEAINKLLVMKAGLENDIEALDKQDVALMFYAIDKEIQELSKSLEVSNNNNIIDLKERLGFLYKFVKGTSIDDRRDLGVEHLKGFNHPDFNKISLALDDLNLKYRAELENFRKEIVNSNISFINNFVNNDKITEAQIEEMFQAKGDINQLESIFLGITESSTNDTLLPQILKSTHEEKITIRESEAKSYESRLNTLVKKIGTNFDFIFEKDAQGNETGNITSVFSPLYRGKLYAYSQIHHNKKIDAEQKYKQKVQWLSDNAEVIDHTKLPIIQELYGDRYAQYFTHSKEEMEAYEKDLKEKLGPLYQSEIDKLLNTLENYQETKEALKDSDNIHKYKNTARVDPWSFIKHFNSDKRNEIMPYNTPSGNTEFVYPDMANTRFIPKKVVVSDWVSEYNEATDDFEEVPITKSSGYYNESFNEIQNDPDKLAYWQLMNEIYGDYVNPTFGGNSGVKNLSYAKFEESYLEAIASAKGVAKVGKAVGNAVKGFKEYFYEKGSQGEETNEVRKSYRDQSKFEISELINVLNLKTQEELKVAATKVGIDPENYKNKEALTKAIATKTVLSNYSKDINKVTAAILKMTALQKAKEDALPIANLILDAHTIASDGKRKRSIARMQNYINRVIKGQNDKARGSESVLGQEFSKEGLLDMILNKTGTVPWLTEILNKNYSTLLSDNEKELLKHLQDVRTRLQTDLDAGKVPIEFNETLKDVEKKIQSLGIHTSAAGITQGIMKIIMLKSMALNPISGGWNRVEGMISGLIMDATGKYWTRGNLQEANRFLVGSNFMKATGLDSIKTKHLQELKKFQMLVNGMNLIQNRKSDLEKTVGSGITGIIEEKLNPFQFAVDNPEMKNQGAILLSILKDTKITDKDGNEVSIFDGKGFPAHEVRDGNLVLKPEFATEKNLITWEHFNIDEQDASNNSYFLTRMKIKNAISRSQGNYDNEDVTQATNNLLGKMATMFMRWMPEHFMQRYASGKGYDLNTGEAKLKGRYRSVWANKHIFFPIVGLGVIAGYGIAAPAVATASGFVALGIGYDQARKYYNKKALIDEAKNLYGLADFAIDVVFNTLNFPLEFVNANVHLKKMVGLEKQIPLDQKTNLNQVDINNLQAVSKEVAIKLTFVALLWAGKQMLTGPDDDEEDKKFANFFDNQVNRMIDSFNFWADPTALYTTAQRLAFFEYLVNVKKVMGDLMTGDEEGKLMKNLAKVSPLPSILTKGELPWHDPYEFNQKQWTDKYAKEHGDGGDEYKAKKEYEALKEEAREEFKEEYSNLSGEALDKAVNKAMRKKFPRKRKDETNESILSRIKAGQHGSSGHKKRKSSY